MKSLFVLLPLIIIVISVVVYSCHTQVQEMFYLDACVQRQGGRNDNGTECSPNLNSMKRYGTSWKCGGEVIQTTAWQPWWMTGRVRIAHELMTEVTDKKVYTSDYSHIETPIFDANYTGGWLKYNDEEAPGTGAKDRPPPIKQKIQELCEKNRKLIGVDNYDESIWRYRVGWYHEVEPNRYGKTADGYIPERQVAAHAYRGPCLWCAQYDGYWIPRQVPLPFSNSSGSSNMPDIVKNITVCSSDFNQRFLQVEVKLPKRAVFNPECNSAGCVGFTGMEEMTSASVKFDVAENGGIQLGWIEWHRYRGIMHITYMDNNFKRVAPDVVMEALDFTGIKAFDNGTLAMIIQRDCDAPAIADASLGAVKAVVVYWKNGTLQWATRLANYWTDENGDGLYLAYYSHQKTSYLKYDAKSQLIYCNMNTSNRRTGLTMGGGHLSVTTFTLNMQGQIVSTQQACSHPQGDRYVVRNGVKAYVCMDDVWGIQPRLQREIGIPEWPDIKYGQAPVRLSSIVPTDDTNREYLLAYLRKPDNRTDKYKINFLLLENGNPQGTSASLSNKKGDRILYFGTNELQASNLEVFNLHLMAYGSRTPHPQFLLHFTTVNCSSETTNEPCDPIENYQLIQLKGDNLEKAGPLIQNKYRIYHNDDPFMYPNGDYIWATYGNIDIVPYMWKTKPANLPRRDTTTTTSVIFTLLKNCNS